MSETTDDLSALAWVYEEVRRSLETAHKALRRFVKESEALAGSDLSVVDPSVLRSARVQIHQCAGALELVGLAPLGTVLRASEASVLRFIAKPDRLTIKAIEGIERASFALLDYIGRVLAGKSVSPLALFPQYRVVKEDARAERVHPADLWSPSWSWRELPVDPGAKALPPSPATRAAIEQELLSLVKEEQPTDAARRLSDIFGGLARGAQDTRVAALWSIAAAVFEAQAQGLLGFDLYTRRLGSRLLAQFRILARGESELSERLALDLLFFCAQSRAASAAAPRLAGVRKAYSLDAHAPVDYSTSGLGRYDPAWVAQARKRVIAAKETWSAVAGGEKHRLGGLYEQFSLVGDSLKRLFPHGETIAAALQEAASATQDAGTAPPASLAMEVATCLLYIEAVLEDAEFDHPAQPERVLRLAARLVSVRQGKPPEPLESWMEDLYRRVSDRQTMGSVVQELRASLAEAETLIDQFFRNTADTSPLVQVPQHLSAMRGVLSVLGMDHAASALARMHDEVDGLASAHLDLSQAAQGGLFDRLADNLGALGFLIDMLSVQPRMAKSLFVYDTVAGSLSPIMGRSQSDSPLSAHAALAGDAIEQRLIDRVKGMTGDGAHAEVSPADLVAGLEKLSRGTGSASRPGMSELARAPAPPKADLGSAAGRDIVAPAAARSSASANAAGQVSVGARPREPRAPTPGAKTPAPEEHDDELLEVFLEEAREVVDTAKAALAELQRAPGELPTLTTIRRSFHTLKGSSRMVGLKDFGEAAWTCEKLYNTRLAEQRAADHGLLVFTDWALGYLGSWVDAIGARQSTEHSSAELARHLAAGDQHALAASTPARAAPAPAPTTSMPQAVAAAPTPRPAAPAPAPAAPGLEFSFDLDLDLAAEALKPSPPVTLSLGDAVQAGPQVKALLDPFEAADVEELSLPETGRAQAPDIEIDAIDLDLGQDFAPVPPPQPARPERVMIAAEPHAPDLPLELTSAASSSGPMPLPEVAEYAASQDEPDTSDSESVKVIGPLRISIALFNIYLNEADELSRRLTTELAEWAMELHRPIGEIAIALAHSLAGSSATVGFTNLSNLARTLEHALTRSQAIGRGTTQEARLFVDAAEEIRRLLHQFAAGFLKDPSVTLLSRLDEHELSSARWLEAVTAAADSTPDTRTGELRDSPAPVRETAPIDAPVLRVSAETAVPLETAPRAQVANAPAPASPARPATAPLTPEQAPARVQSEQANGADADDDVRSLFQPSGFMEWKPSEADATPRAGAAQAAAAQRDRAQSAAPSTTGIDRRETSRVAGDSGDPEGEDDVDAVDAVDAELFPIFEEEGLELLPQLAAQLRAWIDNPSDTSHADASMRTLHTLKGGARLAGAMRLGELAHRLESRIERALARPAVTVQELEKLESLSDSLSQVFDALRNRDAQAYAAAEAAIAAPPKLQDSPQAPEAPARSARAQPPSDAQAQPLAALEPLAEVALPSAPVVRPAAPARPVEPIRAQEGDVTSGIDWSRFSGAASPAKAAERAATVQSAVRVRTPLLDRLVNQAGEVSIARNRIESQVTLIKGSLGDLTDNLERLRAQLRDIELQAETQMSSRLELAKAASKSFDPLEFDRFTRFQEVTRMMAESVNDVATVQRTLQRSLETTEDELVAQARMTRELQSDLLRTRMVEFEALSDRLYRVVRQAAKETGKLVRLDIVGGSIEIDRGVLDRITGSFEHVLRNSVTHGIELPQERSAAGKDPTGLITVTATHEGNEVAVEFRDDGAGLNLPKILERGLAMGLLERDRKYSDAELANLIFASGFSTASSVTELAGRGVGMDVVRNEINAIGGRIRTATRAGQGTSFKLILPLTTAVTQVLMVRCGDTAIAVPSTLIEIVRRATPVEIDQAHTSGVYTLGERQMPFFWLGALLEIGGRSGEEVGRTRTVVVIRSAQKRIAVQVDEVLGNQEVVVKNLGSQLSRVPGLVGITLLASGTVALIYNPVALATLYGEIARATTLEALKAPDGPAAGVDGMASNAAPMILVVDDSLTVRRVTQRLLVREGYRVVLAKDGLDALEKLAAERPQVVLSDIEMPRMDGFELVRNIRNSATLSDLPVIMITSRIAEKHRDHAAELGVDHYLGKPYAEEELLTLIAHYASALSDA